MCGQGQQHEPSHRLRWGAKPMEGFDVARRNITSIHIIVYPCLDCQAAPHCGTMPHLFGKKLRERRMQHQMTQAQLAQQLGLATQSHLSYLESGKSAPSITLAARVASALGVTVDYLLRDSIPIHPPIPQSTAAPDEADIPRRFGDQLRHLRTQQGWSQTQLADRLQPFSQAYISLLENGQKAPSVETLVRCAEIFGVTTDMLLALTTSAQDGA